ncbi:nicotinate-nucleotide--dimethylbenzimidazole phosphoribosyltransferase [Streptomyces sp. NBC_01178]|uniref:nicotinate-nucleotide--dimethylbenzimidazole phosphoribosyltransferase n=1 Tax=Streptomyces sp. NBC_01178 TaxID=2903762 RepID=UPI00386F2B90|nr:nicotinate-nucleotide--dimethylbenzimidazole phosphoribosyltransferase [Streptomyces sp. NBC_01178]
MTDTGQVPGEGLPENAGMVEQPGVPAPDAYTFLDPSEHTPEDDDLLLMPASQGAWSDPQAAPAPAQAQPAAPTAVAPPAPEHGGPQIPLQQGQAAPAPAEPHGTHESGGRDFGQADLNGVRIPAPAPAPVGTHIAATPARRPLHRGPAAPEAPAYGGTQGGVVRSLADRGPAGAARTAAPARHAGPQTNGAEHSEALAEDPSALPGPQPGEIPPQAGAPWGAPQPVAEPAPEQPAVEPEGAVAEPVAVEQAVTEPAATEPAATEPAATEPAATESALVEQAAVEQAGEEARQPGQTEQPEAGPVEAEQPPAAEQPVVEAPAAEPPVQAVEEAPAEQPARQASPDRAAEPVAEPAPAAAPVAPPAQPQPDVEAGQPVAAVETEQSAQPLEPVAEARPEPAPQAVAAELRSAPQAVPAETVVPEPAAGEQPPTGPVVLPRAEASPAQAQAQAPVPAPAEEPAAPERPEARHAAAAPQAAPVVPVEDAAATQPAAQTPAPGEAAAREPAPVESAPAEPEVLEPSPQEQSAEAVAEAVAEPVVAPAAEPVPAAETAPDAASAPDAAADSPQAVTVPEAVVAAEPPAPRAAQPEPSAEPVAEGAAGEDAPKPTDQQPPAPEQETAPAPESAEAARATAPDDEDGAGPEIIETPQLPEPLEAARQAQSADRPAEAVGRQALEPQQAEAQPRSEAPEQSGTGDHPDQADGPAPEEPVRPATPPAPGYDDAEREAVLRVMRERRDIRNGFRGDPIPHEVLLRVLEAAHTAPSVGHSQPWDFVVIRSAETRRSMHELAQRQRDAYAESLPKGRAKQFKELKIEAILDTPVNIVVTADPTRGGRHTLGRHTQPQMAPYSSALAVENLWLAARAEGLGVGWVSFFDEREMVRALGLPEHLEVVAYLCVGYVDEFPEEPELMQAGWSKRRPLSWVVHEETYGRRALPGAEPHDLLQETISAIRPLDAKALGEAWERQKRMTKPAGALGMLEIISAQLSGLSRACPPPIPEPAAVAIFAGDHGVHAQGVTAWPQEVTAQMVANFLGGGAVCNAFAAQVGAEVCVVDVGVAAELPATAGLLPRKVRPGTADFTTGPALSRDDVLAAIEVGIETARDLVAAGNKALLTGEMGIANTTASAALICVYTGADASEVTGRGTGINDEMHARKVDVVRRALDLHQPDPADPVGVLAAVGGLEHAAMAGFLLGGASLRTPVILDGVSAGAAALVARAIAPEALAACIAGHRSAEPGHVAALNKLGLRPLVDLDLRLGEGTGALLALPIVQSAARAMHEVATFDSAGVTEK